MASTCDIQNLQLGDVFYVRGKRREFFGWYGVFAIGYNRRGRRFHIHPELDAADVNRIVKKEKARQFTSRKLEISYCSGGRTEQFKQEKNDCTVRALAIACDVSYEVAFEFMKKKGRKNNKGAVTELVYPGAELNGYAIRRNKIYDRLGKDGILRPLTLNAYLKAELLPKRCIVRVRGHVFAVINNVILDEAQPAKARKVFGIYEVINVVS